MLGPLEVVCSDHLVGLGGTRQRATLGFLLLNTNRVVASSQLIEALWPVGKAPKSARKILQNSVWRLRRALSPDERDAGCVELLSQAPGYMLRVAPDRTDLHNFRGLVEKGRAEMAAGSPEKASLLLRDALALWRGPVLADLVETGIDWPELTSVRNARLDALEDYFEAELACGHHHRIIAELEKTVTSDPLRERLLGQLMLALYRSGRQTDALDVYHCARTEMVEKLGLEPGHALKALQQAILAHDRALVPAGVRQQIDLLMTGAPRDRAEPALQGAPGGPDGVSAQPENLAAGAVPRERRLGQGTAPKEPATRPPTVELPPVDTPVLRTMVAERKDVSVLIVRVQLSTEDGDSDPERIDEAAENAAAVIREEVECLGGTVAASIGPIWLALFGVPRTGEDDAERAVHAAMTIRDRLGVAASPAGSATAAARGVSIQAAVATGEALVRYQPDRGEAPPSVNGALLDECHTLLSLTPVGEIRVCDDTRRATEFAVTYHRGDSSPGWQVGGFRQEYVALHAVPVIDREYDLDVLRGLLQRTRHQATPHLVTVLGEPGIGKTRFIMEFERRVAANPEAIRLLVVRSRPVIGEEPLEVLYDLVASCCGILRGDSAETARAKLTATVERLVEAEEERQWMRTSLHPLLDAEVCTSTRVAVGDALAAARQLLAEIAGRGPLVVVFEDLHWADDVLVDFVEDLAPSVGSLPLLVIATTRPELLKRRPEWGSGIRHGLTLTLEPISDAAIDRLLEFLMSATAGGLNTSAGGLLEALLEGAGDDPAARRVQLRRILASGSASLRDERCGPGAGGSHTAAPDLCLPRSAGHPYR
ncbi:SARP family pathway specific regulatory protein [Streptomyces viridochromogenes DSM 40736]|uniref:SARP family pathway specific regulatory protein n=1 Tax=Streptomyces viridochromogenes (strain DSM 40736 / JCM 4977 / BCRC 1201 / Tue 494) TaxID=591159 RepID=D9X413_STRVT|nr:BTAD domain-containing putative transcriptional regulator [Streptomyces viridochromogenes]EFL33823.1 SARP family pathway specific regulatory protein [Streptomyces viridochromogenes DSM 40736]